MIRSAEKLRVLMIADEYPPTICGIGDYSANLAQALAAKGVDVQVLTKAVAGLAEEETIDGIGIRRLAQNWTLKDVQPIMRAAGQLGPGTIVHLQYPSLTNYGRRLMINLLPAAFRTAKRRWPMVVTMHGFHEHRLRWRMRVLPMLWANSAMVFVHPRDQELAARWAPLAAGRAALIPIASNVPVLVPDAARRERVRRELGIGSEEKVAVFFGEVRPDKGLHTLLDAVQGMHSLGLPARALVISTIGMHRHGLTEYERELMARMATGGREDWAMLVRAETPQRAAEVLQAADVAAFPFTLGAAENRGSLLAAVVNGIGTLTTRGISTPADYELRYGVETVSASDATSFARRLEALLRSEEDRAALAAKAQAAANRFTWSGIAEQNIEVYRKCLAW